LVLALHHKENDSNYKIISKVILSRTNDMQIGGYSIKIVFSG